MSMRIGTPEFGARLGSGRHGTVFHARRGGRDVAVKVAADPHLTALEAAALARFDHPHIVDLVEHPIEGAPLVLEYCAGGTVQDLLVAGPRHTTEELIRLLDPVIDAVAHIHAAGWIHGDISPANLGLRSDGSPVLLDFGASRPADGSPVAEGTPEFLGPLRAATPALDVRSMAAVALALLAPPSRWDVGATSVRHELEALMAAADSGADVGVADLRRALRATPAPAGGGRAGRSGTTIAFGPSPEGAPQREPGRRPRRRALALLPLCVLLAFALTSDLFGPAAADAAAPEATIRVAPIRSAAATLDAAGVSWSVADGTLRHATGADDQRWLVGQPGDLAAVGRWTCTADATLGVYRPSTGEWFVFDSWRDDAESAPPTRLSAHGTLVVELGDACDTPRITD